MPFARLVSSAEAAVAESRDVVPMSSITDDFISTLAYDIATWDE